MDVAVEQFGYVTTNDARSVGVAPATLRAMAHRGDAERVSHGLYRLRLVPHTGRENLMEATFWPRGRGVISHDTALDLWDLCDVNPSKLHVTVPPRMRIRRRPIPALYVVHERDLDPSDVTYIDGIAVVTVRRAILDGMERWIRGDLIEQAISTGRAIGQLSPAVADSLVAALPGR